ncbi:MAG: glycosyltransferase, partial [Elusimicrobia bacterium]|nr:glycosyltransferase [Elusimicrobiota bacterium]
RRRAWTRRVAVVPDAYLGGKPGAPVAHEGLVVTAVGRATYARRPEAFARLAAGLAGRARFLWVGDGELREALTGVEVTGWLSPEEVSTRLLRSDVFVHFSRWEGLPNAVLEAMAHGLPVVASAVPGNKDLVSDGATGFLAGDERVLRTRVEELLGDPSLRARLGAAGKSRVLGEFTLPRLAARLSELYLQEV